MSGTPDASKRIRKLRLALIEIAGRHHGGYRGGDWQCFSTCQACIAQQALCQDGGR